MNAYGLTDRGIVRKLNEDSMYMNREVGLFIVADGMGGHEMGDVASTMATRVIADFILNHHSQEVLNDEGVFELLHWAIEKANDEIYRYSEKITGRCIMGTTVDVVLFVGGKLFIAHIGDSRVYRLQRDGSVQKMTKDHSMAQQLVEEGLLSEEEAENHSSSHKLTRALGVAKVIVPDVSVHEVDSEDTYFLTSDGLLRVINIETIVEQLKDDSSLETKCNSLLEISLNRGAPDNISFIIVEYPG